VTNVSRLVDAVQRAAEDAVTQRGASWIMAVVTVVNGDGTLDISTATGPMQFVRRLRHVSVSAGDKVMVATNADGNWLVVGAIAP
jgi:hypothetical protein